MLNLSSAALEKSRDSESGRLAEQETNYLTSSLSLSLALTRRLLDQTVGWLGDRV